MVTVDLKTFQIVVIFTPDTRWNAPGMFTVDKDIYSLFSGYTPKNEGDEVGEMTLSYPNELFKKN